MSSKKSSGKGPLASEQEEMITEYLQRTNRPYSAIDIFNNLKEKIPKTAVVKLCTSLVESSNSLSLGQHNGKLI